MFFFRAVIHLLIRSKIYQYIAYQRMAGNQLKKFLPVQRYFSCGDGGRTTTQKYVEILEFTHFTEFWTFNEVGANHKEKVQVRKVEVSVVLDLDT